MKGICFHALAVGMLGVIAAQGGLAFAQAISPDLEQVAVGSVARCSNHEDCVRPGLRGLCQNPGEKDSRCVWQEITTIPLFIIEPDQCRSCQVQSVVDPLKVLFPGIQETRLSVRDSQAQEFISKMNIQMLPAYIMGKEIEQDVHFDQVQSFAIPSEGYYYLKPEVAGVSYFLTRPYQRHQLDLFLVLTAPGMYQAAKIAQEISEQKAPKINTQVHFLGIQDPETKAIISPGGEREIHENKVFACVEKHYPRRAWSYLTARIADRENIWIDDILKAQGCDAKRMKACAQSSEGERLYEQKIRLAQELDIHYAPLFLLDNVEIFGVSEQTTTQEILKNFSLAP